MGWWIGVELSRNGVENYQLSDRSVTYNVGPMFRRALAISEPGIHIEDEYYTCRCKYHPGEHETGLQALRKAPCTEVAGILSKARNRMLDNPDDYLIMNPTNGWGSYETALDDLSWLLNECMNNPDGVVYIH